jgi:hypothetical protein
LSDDKTPKPQNPKTPFISNLKSKYIHILMSGD